MQKNGKHEWNYKKQRLNKTLESLQSIVKILIEVKRGDSKYSCFIIFND